MSVDSGLRPWRSSVSRLGPMLTAAALCVVLSSNLVQLRQAHGALETVIANQHIALTNATKAETQLDALAKGTQQLAQHGNANATKIVGELKANGIQINSR